MAMQFGTQTMAERAESLRIWRNRPRPIWETVEPGGRLELPRHPIIIGGDPHGDHREILRACRALQPGTLILLGDVGLLEPLRQAYAEALDDGWTVRYVGGNHDYKTEQAYDNLFVDHPDGDLSHRCIEVDGIRIGGLSGVFRKWAWYPGALGDEPCFNDMQDLLDHLPLSHRWDGDPPLGLRDAIFPADVERLATLKLDVLVTHDCPLTRDGRLNAIGLAAERVGARLVIHGHYHHSYTETVTLPSGRPLVVRGVARMTPWLLEMPAALPITIADAPTPTSAVILPALALPAEQRPPCACYDSEN